VRERKRKTVSESVCNIQIKIERGRTERKCLGKKMNLRERERDSACIYV